MLGGDKRFVVRPAVAEALAEGRPVVALETTVIAHGLPAPHNLESARRLDACLRAAAVVPASIGVLDGRVVVGLDAKELARFADAPEVMKVGRRDLGPCLVGGGLGATTVSATLYCAARAGIAVFATGGIGGVHRGGGDSLDVSADLVELARHPVAVVCAGAKAILDLPRTLEVLETQGVPVIGYGSDRFPAFYCRESGLTLDTRADDAAAAAAILRAQWDLGMTGGAVVAVPPPAEAALDPAAVEDWVGAALAEAEAAGIRGKAVTPFLLRRLETASGGRTVAANVALLENNARVAAELAAALAGALSRR